MSARDRTYRRTEAGFKAWASDKSGLPLPFRRILALVQGDTEFAVIRAGLRASSDHEIAEWLEQLETLGFVESDAGTEGDADFSPAVSLAASALGYTPN